MTRTLERWRLLMSLGIALMLVVGALQSHVAAQSTDVTPEPTKDPAALVDPTLPQETTPEAETTPETTTGTTQTSSAQRVDVATTPGAPATIAHGLAYYDGDDLVWQVQDVKVPVISSASGKVSAPSIVVQREGQSIVRNDTTGKRALLNPGDAFFITAEDSYTIMAEDDGSTIWKFSLVDPDDVASDAFYESPLLTAVRENTYDLQVIRYVLQPGDTADLPSNNGAGMVMPGAGEVQVDHGGQLSILGLDGSHGQGQVLRQPTSISNTGSEPTVVFYLMIGETVSDDSYAAPQRTSTGSSTSSESTTSSSTTTNTTTGEAPDSSQTTQPGGQPQGGPYTAQINIYGHTELWLSVSVDGVVWFEGTLPQGSWTGPLIGTNFEVYTTSGVNTMFENACGEQFYMGSESGEAWYVLTATANSCPPPR